MRTRFAIAPLLLAGLFFAAPATAFETSFDSNAIAAGGEFSYTFTEENEWGFFYNCKFHPNPESMVHVSADSDGATTTLEITIKNDAGGNTIFTPQHAVIEVGDTVIWKNIDTVAHTVTYDAAQTDSVYAANGGGHDNSDGHHDHDDHHHDEDKGSPGFELFAAVAATGAVLALRRK